MHIYLGNKLYSSWSLRPWIAMKAFDIPFQETVVSFTDNFKEQITKVSPTGKVPVLIDGDVVVWESLAIIEYVADKYPEKPIWPINRDARAHARAAASEMHAGFPGLRTDCPMNLGKRYAAKDRGPQVAADVARVTALINDARKRFGEPAGGDFLYGGLCAADAMYAPLITRLDTYSIDVDPISKIYIEAVLNHSAYREWLEAALKEDWIVDEDEVDEPPIENFRPHLAQ